MRVVLADDSVLLREGVARLLPEAGFEVVGQAADARELLEQVAAKQPDVAIVDIRMPPDTDGGLRAAREIRNHHPFVGVRVLSQYARPSYAFELLSGSAERVVYLLKDRVGDLAELADAVRRAAREDPFSTQLSSHSSSVGRGQAPTRSTTSASGNGTCSR